MHSDSQSYPVTRDLFVNILVYSNLVIGSMCQCAKQITVGSHVPPHVNILVYNLALINSHAEVLYLLCNTWCVHMNIILLFNGVGLRPTVLKQPSLCSFVPSRPPTTEKGTKHTMSQHSSPFYASVRHIFRSIPQLQIPGLPQHIFGPGM